MGLLIGNGIGVPFRRGSGGDDLTDVIFTEDEQFYLITENEEFYLQLEEEEV